MIDELGNLAKGVDLSSTDLKHADDRVAKLLEVSEGLIALIADSGVETSDAPLIRVVVDTAKTDFGRVRSRRSRAARSRSIS